MNKRDSYEGRDPIDQFSHVTATQACWTPYPPLKFKGWAAELRRQGEAQQPERQGADLRAGGLGTSPSTEWSRLRVAAAKELILAQV